MADCKLVVLETRFTPGLIELHIELAPIDGHEFDLPMEDAGKKLSAVANYARETFGVRTTPVSPNEPGSQGKTGAPRQAPTAQERKAQDLAKNMRAGAGRAIQVMEGELARAKAGNDTPAIKKAEAQLDRAKAMKNKQKSGKT